MTWDDFDTDRLKDELRNQMIVDLEEQLNAGEPYDPDIVKDIRNYPRPRVIALLQGYGVKPSDLKISVT